MSNVKCQMSKRDLPRTTYSITRKVGVCSIVLLAKRASGAGFTLVELILVMTIMATLIGLITINLSYSERKTTLNSTVQTIISDLRQQQIKAMIGDFQGWPTPDSYGIHLDTNQYILFHGITYSPTEPSNSKISLPQNIQFVNSGIDIIFSKISGDISLATTIILKDSTNNNEKTIQLNRYGVIKGVN